MGTSVLIVAVVMFLVFMFSLKNISDAAKTVTLVVSAIGIAYILYKVIWG